MSEAVWDPFSDGGTHVPQNAANPSASPLRPLAEAPRRQERPTPSALLTMFRAGIWGFVGALLLLVLGVVMGNGLFVFLAILGGVLSVGLMAAIVVGSLVFGVALAIPGITKERAAREDREAAQADAVRRLGLGWGAPAAKRMAAINAGLPALSHFTYVDEVTRPQLDQEAWGAFPDGTPFWLGFVTAQSAVLSRTAEAWADRHGNSSPLALNVTLAVGFPLGKDSGLVGHVKHVGFMDAAGDAIKTESAVFNEAFEVSAAASGTPAIGTAEDIMLALLTPAAQQMLLDMESGYDKLVLAVRGEIGFLVLQERLGTLDPEFIAPYLGEAVGEVSNLAVLVRRYMT